MEREDRGTAEYAKYAKSFLEGSLFAWSVYFAVNFLSFRSECAMAFPPILVG